MSTRVRGQRSPQRARPRAEVPREFRVRLGLTYFSALSWPLALAGFLVLSNPKRSPLVHRHALQALVFGALPPICWGASFLLYYAGVPPLLFIFGAPLAAIFSIYHGVSVWKGTDTRVPLLSDWLESHALPAKLIFNETNVEVRRDLIDRLGAERFLRESEATVVASDDYGRLMRCDLPGDEPFVMVEVVNSTPEGAGYRPAPGEAGVWNGNRWFKLYVLRVDPRCRTAREAVAWTFGMTEEGYEPGIQT